GLGVAARLLPFRRGRLKPVPVGPRSATSAGGLRHRKQKRMPAWMPAMSLPGETALVQPRARGDWPGPHAHRLGRTTTPSQQHENRNEAKNYAFGTDDARQLEMTTLADNGIAMMGALGGCRIFARTQKAIEQTGRNGASNNPPLLRFDIDRTKKDKKSDESKTDIGDK